MPPRPCPCGLPEPFDACCGRYLGESGATAPTAEALMRSRYTAFARGDVDHLLRTWHPATRPATLTLDPSIRWTRLEVLDRVGGGLLDTDGIVEFRAHHCEGPQTGVLHERSRFVREGGRWLYRDGAAR
ncbi:YchJ family metal-binding protein [Actinomycetospora lutea]|uniref:YchJ family protein n=1 Tax=Actinomycetospora lutea TaxID=663604 RepID=UPI0023655CBA|nr:YchJ family metal-binding protein [Actinomycetospora lutea]MDD7939506.1 YchJ family metal-binding protein [Actinomycetospora lutea]